MEIRRANVADWELSRDIRLRALADSPGAFLSTLERELAFDDDVWKSRLEAAYTALAIEGDSAVGVAVLVDDQHEAGSREIVGMWVDPLARGSGLADALIEHLVAVARTADASAIALWVADGNDRARRVYERCGFVATGQRDVMREGLGEERMRRGLG